MMAEERKIVQLWIKKIECLIIHKMSRSLQLLIY